MSSDSSGDKEGVEVLVEGGGLKRKCTKEEGYGALFSTRPF
jgi:hypothetical protein